MAVSQINSFESSNKIIIWGAMLVGPVFGLFLAIDLNERFAQDWGALAAMAAGFVAFIIIVATAQSVVKWRKRRLIDSLFPDHSGESIPVFLTMALKTAEGVRDFTSPLRNAALHDAGERIFVKKADSASDEPDHFLDWSFLLRPDRPTIWAPLKADVKAVELIEVSEETFARTIADDTSLIEKLAVAGMKKAMGVKAKESITPFAAILVIHVEKDGKSEQAWFAIPTTALPRHLMDRDYLAEKVEELWEDAVANASDKAESFMKGQGLKFARAVIGESVVGTMTDIAGYRDEFDALVDAGSIKIDGGSRMATLVVARVMAERVRRMTECSEVRISSA